MSNFEYTNEKLPLEDDLRTALEKKEFLLYYQPKLDFASGKIIGVEALIRWEHPVKGMIPPLEFIPLAEETELIIPIGEWVLREACYQNMKWQKAGLNPLIMAVNLCACQLYYPNLVKMVQQVLEETGMSPAYLELEITESMMMDVEHVLPVLLDLKRIGVRISLDDFGTGYSSLYYLKEFPIDIIKIDQSFIRNCTTDMKDSTIVKAIIAMARQLQLEVIAEGIETSDQLIFLQQQLCNRGQGYFFSKPLPPQEFVQKITELEEIVHREGIPQEISRQKWLEEELENARRDLRNTLRLQQGMIIKFVERNGKFIHTLCDGELLYRIGLCPEKLIGKELHDVLPYDEAERKLQYYKRAWKGEENVTYEGKLGGVWYLASLRPIRRGGQVIEVIGSCVDITERKENEEHYQRIIQFLLKSLSIKNKAERDLDLSRRKRDEDDLRKSVEQYRLIAENMTDLVCVIDWDGFFKYASPSHVTVLGFPSEGYEGNRAKDWMHEDDFPHVRMKLEEMVKTKERSVFEFRFRDLNGNWIWLEGKGTPVFNEEGQFKHFLVVSREITERKMFEKKLRHMAYHDTLTELPNRRLFNERLEQALKEAKRYGRKMAVMYMDMDNFKHINDTLGHDVGDALLKQFAQRVKRCLRESDTLSRHGGDEFIILLPDINEEQEVLNIANRILSSHQKPWYIEKHIFYTTSSIGIAFYPQNGKTRHELLKNADKALYQAKKAGRNNVQGDGSPGSD